MKLEMTKKGKPICPWCKTNLLTIIDKWIKCNYCEAEFKQILEKDNTDMKEICDNIGTKGE